MNFKILLPALALSFFLFFTCKSAADISNPVLTNTATAAVYYVDLQGSDETGDGSWNHPFATLAQAVERVRTPGDVIHINEGIYQITSSCELAEGVSIEGERFSRTVLSSFNSSPYGTVLSLRSEVVNSPGNQYISGIGFHGNFETAWGAIYIQARGNVHIYDCSFENFMFTAVIFNGKVEDYDNSEPVGWSENCSFYNNTVINCCEEKDEEWMTGALHIGAQDGMEIYNNYFNETARGSGKCGYPIKYYNSGYNRNLKIHDNRIIKLPSSTDWNDWNFAIELWNYRGAVEIYNNYIEGSIDIDHVQKGIYDYGLKIYNNYIGYKNPPPSSGNWAAMSGGLYIEYASEDIYIYNNQFHNLESPIRFAPRNELIKDIYIYYNIFNEIGNLDSDEGCCLMIFSGEEGYRIENLNFVNNTVYAGDNGALYGIYIPAPAEKFKNLTIQNNIFTGFRLYPIDIDGAQIEGLFIENNAFGQNGINAAHVTGRPIDYINRNNVEILPDFSNPGVDFSLKSAYLLHNGGVQTGYQQDYEGNVIIGLPDIGAYEYCESK